MKVLTPRPYQHLAMDFMLSHKRCALLAKMGMGKTASTLLTLDVLYNFEGYESPTLVLAPRRVAEHVWPDEAKAWSNFGQLKVLTLAGLDPPARKLALRQHAHVHCINYDLLPWLVDYWGHAWPYRIVVPDEATKLKSFRLRQGGVRAQSLASVAHLKCDRFIELTGTPSPNGLLDLWGQMWFLDEGARLGRTFTSFRDRWFRPENPGADPRAVRWVPFDHSQAQIMAAVSDLCLALDPKDWFDLRDPVVTTVQVDLEPSARAKYDVFERDMFLALKEGEVEAFGGGGKVMKCLQLANGAVYFEDRNSGNKDWVEVSYAKLDALESIINESGGEPIIVAYHFKSDLARLKRAFPQARAGDDPGVFDDWNAGRVPILLLHPASAGHGLSLQHGGSTIVFFSHWWDLEQHDQIIERIGPTRQAQSGYDRSVMIYYLVATDTVDEVVMERRASKRATQDLLMDYMKRKKR